MPSTVIPEIAPFPEARAFLAMFLSWFLSQLTKVIRGIISHKKFNVRWVFDTGGMPSSHSASVASVAASTGFYFGFNSMLFLIVLTFTIITMFDAAGVRRSVGRQAIILNKMIDEGGVQEKRLKELLGHTPFEVFAGAFLGVIITSLLCRP